MANSGDDGNGNGNGSVGGDAQDIIDARGLSPEDVSHALKSFVAPGEHDEFYIFSSGGHSGQIIVIGVPSMRILKVIGVFTPEPWQGYGYGSETDAILAAGTNSDKPGSEDKGQLTWGDTHHPGFSETDGEYDGRWVYINDRANGRIAMVDLRDWKTKEIFDVPNLQTSHGGIFRHAKQRVRSHLNDDADADRLGQRGRGARRLRELVPRLLDVPEAERSGPVRLRQQLPD